MDLVEKKVRWAEILVIENLPKNRELIVAKILRREILAISQLLAKENHAEVLVINLHLAIENLVAALATGNLEALAINLSVTENRAKEMLSAKASHLTATDSLAKAVLKKENHLLPIDNREENRHLATENLAEVLAINLLAKEDLQAIVRVLAIENHEAKGRLLAMIIIVEEIKILANAKRLAIVLHLAIENRAEILATNQHLAIEDHLAIVHLLASAARLAIENQEAKEILAINLRESAEILVIENLHHATSKAAALAKENQEALATNLLENQIKASLTRERKIHLVENQVDLDLVENHFLAAANRAR